MFRYYWSLIREIPRAIREAHEGVAYWIAVGVVLLTWFLPSVGADIPQNLQLPLWGRVTVLVLVLLYGFARANYNQVAALQADVAQLEISDRETYEKLAELAASAQRLLREREQIKYDIKAKDIWRKQYYDLKDQIDVRLTGGERLDLLSEFYEIPGNDIWDQWEDNVRRASPKLVALVMKYETRAEEK